MKNIHELQSIHKDHFSHDFSRTLPLALEWLEREYRRPIGACFTWSPAQQECFEQAHQGLAGLMNIQEEEVDQMNERVWAW